MPAAAFNLRFSVETPSRRVVPRGHGHGRPNASAGDVSSWLHARAADRAYVRKTTIESAARSLRDADAALTNALRSGQSEAYRGHLAEAARLHRPDVMPIVGEQAIVAWLASQPRYAAGESSFADTSMAGDLGYTYGTYALDGNQAAHGFYVRNLVARTRWCLARRPRRSSTCIIRFSL
jgi:hypothetical protein